MRLFSSEIGQQYSSYTFGYANYCEREPEDSLADIYNLGYLPYSGTSSVSNTLYMARSARVALKEFALTSENRRIAKKFDGQFEKSEIPIADFIFDEAFYTFCLNYFAERHGDAMPRKRFEYILKSNFSTHVLTYKQNEAVVAYVLLARDKNIEHYWFSFYDLAFAKQSLGLWLMIDCIRTAAALFEYYYLGTVYGEKALYKTNFESLEWWGGHSWNTDISKLKELGRSDEERLLSIKDTFKKGFSGWK